MNRSTRPEIEIKIPPLHQWWIATLAPLQLSAQEREKRCKEMTPRCFKRLESCKEEERRILSMLRGAGRTKEEKAHLRSALTHTRSAMGTLLGMIADWGMTAPEIGHAGF